MHIKELKLILIKKEIEICLLDEFNFQISLVGLGIRINVNEEDGMIHPLLCAGAAGYFPLRMEDFQSLLDHS